MYVCVCHGVNEKRIRQACQEGACSFKEISENLGVGRSCGKCRDHVVQMIETNRTPASSPVAHMAEVL